MSKGSQRRPLQVSDIEFAERWDAIFGDTGKVKVVSKDRHCRHGVSKNVECIYCNPPKEPNPYAKYFKCNICGCAIHNGHCDEILRQQVERT